MHNKNSFCRKCRQVLLHKVTIYASIAYNTLSWSLMVFEHEHYATVTRSNTDAADFLYFLSAENHLKTAQKCLISHEIRMIAGELRINTDIYAK